MRNDRNVVGGKLLWVAAGAVVLGGIGGAARASIVAADNVANNPPYNGYVNFNGLNGGSGFGPWSAGNVSGSSGGAYTQNDMNLNSPGNAGGFDIFDNGVQGGGALTDEVAAIRPFTGALGANQDFSFVEQLNNGSNPTNGGPSNFGFSLEDSSGTALFDFHAQGGGPGYQLSDATQSDVTETTVPYNYHAIDAFSFLLTSVGATSANYSFTASGGNVSGGSQTFTGTISMLTGGVSQVEIYNNNGGEGSDFEFDNLAITNVPEPVSLAAAGMGATMLMIRRRRRES